LRGWYREFDQNIFDIHTFYLGTKSDQATQYANSKSTFFKKLDGESFHGCVQSILDCRLDILFYPAIGMDFITLKLACLRLAPTQISSWGHPETTGLPTIDYFISAEDFESPNSQDYYSERLICMPRLGCTYPPLPVESVNVDFAEIGIEFGVPLLVCPGIPAKYVSRHDYIFVEIARKLGRCRFVFFTPQPADQAEKFKLRLERAFTNAGLDFSEYCVFVRWLGRAEFFALMRRAHVFLDTIGFSGFNTAMQAVQCDLPIVTKNGAFMRGRFASGILRRLGLPQLIAETEQEYIDLAVKLALDDDYRSAIRSRMKECSAALFDDPAPSIALNKFLAEVSGRA
jgi:predicted O-linked N-acetylglucosamine transferase (SPINDLY family)